MNDLTFTPFESQVLEWLLKGEDTVLAALREQLALCKIQSREFSKVGFYLDFDVPSVCKRLQDIVDVKPDFCFGDVDVMIVIGSYQQNVGFLLWVKDGHLNYLEAYTYGFEKWPERFNKIHLRYMGMGDQRDLDHLRQNWKSQAIK